jgi:UPF0176 protein
MPLTVAALYQFLPLPDFAALRAPVAELCAELGLCGTLLLAPEGLNGTVAGHDDAIARFVPALDALFGGRLDRLELKLSPASAPPFDRMKVRLKREIVTIGDPAADPLLRRGRDIAPTDWNALLDDPGVTVIDTRNAFEVAMGSFDGALDPQITRFGAFPDFVRRRLDPARHRRVALFCTGGIRCEKASAHLRAQGFDDVMQLQGGILRYLQDVPATASRWRGGCFVFDQRIALGHGLVACPPLTLPEGLPA